MTPKQRSPKGAYYSKQPWLGFSKGDNPRRKPLPRCPAARCRRAKACVAAHDGLYCRRTHHSPGDPRDTTERAKLQKRLDRAPKIDDPKDLEWSLECIRQAADIQRAHFKKMTARWKSGEFDRLYGKYRRHGVLVEPPSRVYVENEGRARADKEGGHGEIGHV